MTPDATESSHGKNKDPETIVSDYYADVVERVKALIDWYDQKAARFGRWSRRLRILAIVFGAIGSLSIAVSASGVGTAFGAYWGPGGLIALAAAAAWVAVDRLFGFSAGWMRFRQTELRLRRALDDFKYEWAALNMNCAHPSNGPVPCCLRLKRIRQLLERAYEEWQAETDAWMREFRRNLSALERYVHAERGKRIQDASDIHVMVENTEGFEGVEAYLDGVEHQAVTSGTCVFSQVTLRRHIVYAQGMKDDKLWRSPRQPIEVTGGNVSVSVDLSQATVVTE